MNLASPNEKIGLMLMSYQFTKCYVTEFKSSPVMYHEGSDQGSLGHVKVDSVARVRKGCDGARLQGSYQDTDHDVGYRPRCGMRPRTLRPEVPSTPYSVAQSARRPCRRVAPGPPHSLRHRGLFSLIVPLIVLVSRAWARGRSTSSQVKPSIPQVRPIDKLLLLWLS